MAFTPRLTAPSRTQAEYLCTAEMQRQRYGRVITAGGLNECIVGNNSNDGSALPNCVGYSWGRWYEILGIRPNLSRGDGGTWYRYNDGYERRDNQTQPQLGDVMCWGSSGAGHVNIVEQIISSTEIITSNSYWTTSASSSGQDFALEYARYVDGAWKRYNYRTGYLITGYTYQGAIILPTTVDNVLNDIELNYTPLSGIFEPYQFNYTVSTDRPQGACHPVKRYTGQTTIIQVNDTFVGDAETINWEEGENSVIVNVYYQDTVTRYYITVFYGTTPTEDNLLESLNITGTNIVDIFSPYNLNYSTSTEEETSQVIAVAESNDAEIEIYFNGDLVASGQVSIYAEVTWTSDDIVQIKVTNNGETRTYTVLVGSSVDIRLANINVAIDKNFYNMLAYKPPFDSDVGEYRLSTSYDFIYVLPVALDSRADIDLSLNGRSYIVPTSYYPLQLKRGKNTIVITVSGEDEEGDLIYRRYFLYVTCTKFNVILATKLL